MIMNKTNLNYDKDFKFMIGDYGMSNAPTDNTMKARAAEAVYLRPVDSAQGGHECMHLQTGKKIVSTKFHPLLITDAAIQRVEEIATKQGILSFKVVTRDGRVLYDSAKIAGVDNDKDEASHNQNDEKSIIEEYELYNEEFEEAEEPYESTDDEESQYSSAHSNEANYEQNNNENNNEDYPSQDSTSEGTIEDAYGHEDDSEDVEPAGLRRSTRTTKDVERLDPQWKGQMYHQTKSEHAKMDEHIKNTNNEVERMNYSCEEVARDLEHNHNITWQSTANKESRRTVECSHCQGLVLARFINDFQEG